MSLPSDGSTDLHLPALKLFDVSGNKINYFNIIVTITYIMYLLHKIY